MNSLFGFVASYVVNAVWEVAVIFAVAWLTSRLLKRLGSQAEHTVWVAALMMSVAAPALPVFRRLLETVTGSQTNGGVTVIALSAGGGGAAAHAGTWVLPAFWMWWLLVCYAAAFVYFAGCLVLRIRAAFAILRDAGPAALTPEQEQIWHRCEGAFSLKGARILACAATPGPVALGLRRPILLLPSDFASRCMPQDFLAALAHECAHLKRRDFQKNLFYEFASLVLAFHPLIGVIKSGIARTREMVCDGMATKGNMDAGNYARSLLRLATMVAVEPRATGNYAVGIFDGNVLEQRIARIRMKKQDAGAVIRYGLMLSSAVILIITLAGAAAMAVSIVPETHSQDAPQSSAYGHVYKVGNGVSAPVVLNKVEAHFPKSARKDKGPVDGIVLVRLIVDAEGLPQGIHVVRSYRPDFDAEAVKAVKRYRFKPAMRSGQSVAVSITIEIRFKRY